MVLTLILSLFACAPIAPSISEISAQQLVNAVIESHGKYSSYGCEWQFYMGSELEEGLTPFYIEEVEIKTKVDIENKKMEFERIMSWRHMADVDDFLSGGRADMKYYVVDDVLYSLYSPGFIEDIWRKESGMLWEDMELISALEYQIEFLQEAPEVEITGSEKILGIDCYILNTILDIDKLRQMYNQQIEIPTEELSSDTDKRQLEIKYWISKDTYFLAKAQIDTTHAYPDEVSSQENKSLELGLKMDGEFFNYNQPVSIMLPPESQEATEIEM